MILICYLKYLDKSKPKEILILEIKIQPFLLFHFSTTYQVSMLDRIFRRHLCHTVQCIAVVVGPEMALFSIERLCDLPIENDAVWWPTATLAMTLLK